MTKKKSVRQKGKIRFSECFKKVEDGTNVAIVCEQTLPSAFPKRIVGKTGKVVGSRGSYKIVRINDGNLPKQFIVHPINLRKIW
jgi:ribosomal protein L21E